MQSESEIVVLNIWDVRFDPVIIKKNKKWHLFAPLCMAKQQSESEIVVLSIWSVSVDSVNIKKNKKHNAFFMHFATKKGLTFLA